MQKVLISPISLFLIVLLVSCGGGGTSGESPPTQPYVVANVETEQYVPVGSTVTLDGSGSFSSNGNQLLYHWYLNKPPGSNATDLPINSFNTQPTFIVDVEGLYTISLTVTDFSPDASATPSSSTAFVIAPPLTVFGGANDDTGYSVQQTVDGGYIVIGHTEVANAGSGIMSLDVYMIKTNANGHLVWEKTFGGTSNEYGYAVQQTTDGGYVIAGSTSSVGSGGQDLYLIKTDAVGDLVWEQTYGGVNGDAGYSVQQTTDSGYVVAGYTYSSGSGQSDLYLIKTDATGNLLWEQTFGGISYDVGRSVQQTVDGGYIIAGFSNSLGAGAYDAYLIKTDAVGNLTWEKTYGGLGDDLVYSVQQTADDGYILAGNTNSMGLGREDAYLVKTDLVGDLVWEETFGGINDDYAYSVQQTDDGGYILAGNTNSMGFGDQDVYLIKTDDSGVTMWEKNLGGLSHDFSYSVRQTVDGEYIVSGKSNSMGAGGYDVYLVKTDGLFTTW